LASHGVIGKESKEIRCDKELDMLYSLVAVSSLILAVAFAPVIGAALLVLLLLGLFLLAMVGVFMGVEDRTVRQRDPVLDPKGWRNGP
jgi:hypothetical protein